MEWLKSKTAIVAGGCLALVGLQGYNTMSMRSALENRVSVVERQLESTQSEDSTKMAQIAADLDLVTKKLGITTQELQQAHAVAQQLKLENAQAAQRLRRELAAKADATQVQQFRDEASTKLSEVQQDATTRIAGVSGDVQGVRGDVQGVRSDLDATREDLAGSKRDLNTLIARNSTELAELRRRGERDFVEFDIRKGKKFDRIGDVLVQLTKADAKRQKFDVVINADDSNITKKDRTANEPITFLVGRDRLRYEIVVNYVDKDRVRGYLSTPKDRRLAAETPSASRQP